MAVGEQATPAPRTARTSSSLDEFAVPGLTDLFSWSDLFRTSWTWTTSLRSSVDELAVPGLIFFYDWIYFRTSWTWTTSLRSSTASAATTSQSTLAGPSLLRRAPGLAGTRRGRSGRRPTGACSEGKPLYIYIERERDRDPLYLYSYSLGRGAAGLGEGQPKHVRKVRLL